jgi:hypothetical protein
VDNGPAFSKTGVISAKNMSHSSHLDARDQLKQTFGEVRLKRRMGSQVRGPRTFGRRWLTARPRASRRGRSKKCPCFAGGCAIASESLKARRKCRESSGGRSRSGRGRKWEIREPRRARDASFWLTVWPVCVASWLTA